jgi:RsiW-degrading membrane proteinase PrsW (M82 family)
VRPRARSGKLHWLVAVTFLPLALMVAHPTATENDLPHRFERTIANASPEVAHKVDRLLHSTNTDLDEVLSVLPDDRIEGAYLPRVTTRHWLFGAESTILFLIALPLLFPWTSKRDAPLLLVSLFTATVGVGFVLIAQQVLFARSYALADDPDGNVFSSMLGFTTGVGLCEELAKALPLIGFLLAKKPLDWRTGCLWGLASGVGFGVSEGIMYSSRQYNGLSGGDIYLVRFLSCVALHAIWAASAGIVLCERRKALSEAKSFNDVRWAILRALAAPMILHAFYDTLLSFDQDFLALLAAFGSVAWFATEVSRAEREEGAPVPGLAPTDRQVVPRFAG